MPSRSRFSGDALVITICASLAFANCFSGYDTASAAAVVSDQRFLDQWTFSSAETGAFGVLINVGNCLSYLGPLIWLNKRFGRKVTMTIGNLTLMVGAALVAGAVNLGMLFFGRILCGMGVSLCQGCFAGWTAELASPRARGAAVCIVQVSYNLGVFIAFWVSLGTVKIPGTNAWRTVIALQVIFGIILFAATCWSPEAPRMLFQLSKDPGNNEDPKVMKARKNLCYIRRLEDHDPELNQEFNELQAAAILQRRNKAEYSLKAIVTSKAFWRRFAIGAGSCVFAQLTGVAALMLYGIVVFTSLGLGGNSLSLITNGVSGSIQLLSCFFAVFFVDKLGRRRVMICGLAIACVGYLFLGALFERWPQANNRAAGGWMIVCIFAIQCSYAGALGPVAYLLATEVWPQELRELGISVSLLSLFIAVIIINQLWPVLTEEISFRLYWIFLVINLITLTLTYLFWPETKGRSLDEMDSLFGELDIAQKARVEVGVVDAVHDPSKGVMSGRVDEGELTDGMVEKIPTSSKATTVDAGDQPKSGEKKEEIDVEKSAGT